MAADIEDEVQLIMESSWTVSRGSLESCITVVFVDPSSQEPIVPSYCDAARVSLVPAEESVPCEVTIKFQGRQCEVQSLYILSTARTYELYSQADLMMDREYVCTVRGCAPDKENEAGCSDGSLKMAHADCRVKSAPEDVENENILGDTEHVSDDWDNRAYPSCKGREQTGESASQVINGNTDVLDSVGLENEDPERSIYSSGEDSWVDIKFSGSFSGESLSELSMPTQDSNGKLDGSHQRRDCMDRHSLENNPRTILFFTDELNCASLVTKGCCLRLCEEEKVESRDLTRSLPLKENMYEAELDLVDHCSWTSLTIRFLSLKNRSCVEIEQMVLLVVPGPPVSKATSSNQFLCGHDSSALLTMLIPSMLRMVQGASNQTPKDASHGYGNSGSMTLRPTVDSTALKKHERSFVTSHSSLDATLVVSTEDTMKVDQDVTTPVENTNSVTKHSTACSISGTESNASLAETTEKPLQPTVNALSEREVPMIDSEEPMKEPLQPARKAQLACKAGSSPHSCEYEKTLPSSSLPSNLDPFLERFDRLEALCMRMEAYIAKAVENLDQRLTHLERQHTTTPMFVSLEPGCVTSKESYPLSSTQSLPVSPLSSGACCLEAKEEDAVESYAQIQTTIYQKADTRQTAVEAQSLDFSGINTSTEASIGAVDDVSKAFQVEVPAFTGTLESRPSEMPEVRSYTEGKSQISLDDAWNSAFSSSCSPVQAPILSPFVDKDAKIEQDILLAMEDNQSCGSQTDAITSIPCVDLECTLLKETWLLEESPANSSLEIEKPIDCQQSRFHNHNVDNSFDLVCDKEGVQTVPFCEVWSSDKTESFVIDLQGHSAGHDWLGGVLKGTEVENCMPSCSREDIEKVSNGDAVFDLMSCCLHSIQSEQETIMHEINNLVSDLGKSDFKKIRAANLDSVEAERLHGCSYIPNRLIDIECKEDEVPSVVIALDNVLGDDIANDAYDTACSESSTCISQEFDTFHDHISVYDWATSQNSCLVGDHRMTDTDIRKHGLDLEEIFFMNDNVSVSSSSYSKEGPILHSFLDFSLSIPHLLDVDQAPQQQPTGHAMFPGFEDIL